MRSKTEEQDAWKKDRGSETEALRWRRLGKEEEQVGSVRWGEEEPPCRCAVWEDTLQSLTS